MLARLCAFVIWALVAATAVFWGLRLFVAAPSAPPGAVAVGDAAEVRVDLTRLLGAAPVAPAAAVAEASARFKLLGIMAPPGSTLGNPSNPSNAAQGVALIAVDGKLARAYRVGAALDAELVLLSVSLRSAAIGPARGAPTVMLNLPALPAAATGTLPAPGLAPATPVVAPGPQIQPAPGGPAGAMPVPPREPGAPTE